MAGQKALQDLKNEDRVRKCPECGSTNITYEKGEYICKKCGLVLD